MADGGTVAASVEAAVFLQELHDALVHLRDLPLRHSHPLGRRLNPSEPISPSALQRALLDAIERLRPPARIAPDAPRSRRYRYLTLRYVEGARLEQVVAELGISERQARREHHAALEELGALLVGRERSFVPAPIAPPINATSGGAGSATAESEDGVSADLEAELSPLEASPEVAIVRLGTAVEDAIELVTALAARDGIRIVHAGAPTSPEVHATPTVLRQILLNVLGHLIDGHVPEVLQIDVVERERSGEIHFRAIGPRRADPPPGDASPALQTARRLAEGQEATLWTERSNPRSPAVHLRFATTAAPLLLIVDDNPGLARMFRRFLHGADARLIQARSGSHAQALARRLRPDLIILDLMMPVQDGWDLFRALRADAQTRAIPIIACSVLPERELALSLGVDDFLAKPVTAENLAVALSRYLQPPSIASPDAAFSRYLPPPSPASGEAPSPDWLSGIPSLPPRSDRSGG